MNIKPSNYLDFQNVLNHCTNAELLKMTEVCLTSEWLKSVVVAQPESVLCKIREDYKLPNNYEVAELIHRLNQIEFSDVLNKYISRSVLTEQLHDINPDTKEALINYKMSEERKKFVVKLENAKKVYESNLSGFEKITELMRLNTPEFFISINKEQSSTYRETVEVMIDELVKQQITKFFEVKFTIKINGKIKNKGLPEHINIRGVHGQSVVFDFYVKKGGQEISFNGKKLYEANHFFLLRLGDLKGFDESERFRHLPIIPSSSLCPFMSDLYIYDITFWDDTDVCGVLNNMGDVILPPKFSTINEVGISEYIMAYRLKLHGEIEGEGWEYYTDKGKRVSGEMVEGEPDEKFVMDSINRYKAVKEIIWSQQELNDMRTIGQKKFSKWFRSFDELKELTEAIVIDYKTVYRNPNIKNYLVDDFYICFSNLNGKELIGLGIDPDMNKTFNPDEE